MLESQVHRCLISIHKLDCPPLARLGLRQQSAVLGDFARAPERPLGAVAAFAVAALAVAALVVAVQYVGDSDVVDVDDQHAPAAVAGQLDANVLRARVAAARLGSAHATFVVSAVAASAGHLVEPHAHADASLEPVLACAARGEQQPGLQHAHTPTADSCNTVGSTPSGRVAAPQPPADRSYHRVHADRTGHTTTGALPCTLDTCTGVRPGDTPFVQANKKHR